MSKLVVIVQCELVTRRCSGYNCMKAFTQRSGKKGTLRTPGTWLSTAAAAAEPELM